MTPAGKTLKKQNAQFGKIANFNQLSESAREICIARKIVFLPFAVPSTKLSIDVMTSRQAFILKSAAQIARAKYVRLTTPLRGAVAAKPTFWNICGVVKDSETLN